MDVLTTHKQPLTLEAMLTWGLGASGDGPVCISGMPLTLPPKDAP